MRSGSKALHAHSAVVENGVREGPSAEATV